jgi:O-antigen/teichoic acid export membrane protein
MYAAMGQVIRLRLRTAAIWLAALAAGVAVIDRLRDIPWPALAAFGAASLCAATSVAAVAMLRAQLLFRRAALCASIGRWLTALISLAALPMIGLAHGLDLFAFATLAGEAAVLISAVAALFRSDRTPAAPAPAFAAAAEARRWLTLTRALPYAANGLLAVFYNRIDVLIVGGLAAAGQLAFYAPASRIQDALYLVPSSLESVAFPVMAQVFNSPAGIEGVARLVRRFTLAGLVVSIPLTCTCYVYTPQLLRYALGPSYLGAAAATRVLIWFLPVACVSAPMITALAACGRVIDTTKVFAVAAAVAISMHLALDARLGAIGGALASLLRDPFALAATYLLARRAGLTLAPSAQMSRRRILEPGAIS